MRPTSNNSVQFLPRSREGHEAELVYVKSLRASDFDWVTKRPPEADYTKESQSALSSESASGGPSGPKKRDARKHFA